MNADVNKNFINVILRRAVNFVAGDIELCNGIRWSDWRQCLPVCRTSSSTWHREHRQVDAQRSLLCRV